MKIVLYVVGVILLLIVIYFTVNIFTKPMQLINKTMEVENIIHNYEWFHDVYQGIEAQVANIRSYKEIGGGDQYSKIELIGMQQVCRSLVSKYNAASSKVNVSIFKGNSLPENINITKCN